MFTLYYWCAIQRRWYEQDLMNLSAAAVAYARQVQQSEKARR